MNRSHMCVANVQYKKPTERGEKESGGLLGYLTYRESHDEQARHAPGRERWEDHGLGHSIAEITERLNALRSQHVLMFSLVYNVNPDLIAMVEPQQREQFVRELTVKTTEAFFEARGIDSGVEYAFVLHHRQTDDPQAPGQHNPHTHVVLPGTVYDDGLGERVPLYFNQNRQVDHIALLHNLTESQMAVQMDRYVGRGWEQRYDALEAARTEERLSCLEPAHGTFIDHDLEIPFWCGERQVDEDTSDVGYYRAVDDGIEFRPLVRHLKVEHARLLLQQLEREMGGNFNELHHLAEIVNELDEQDRDDLFDRLRVLVAAQPLDRDHTPDLSIDF